MHVYSDLLNFQVPTQLFIVCRIVKHLWYVSRDIRMAIL